MKRLGFVLLLLAMGVQFSAGARVFDDHERWTRTCESDSHHFCSDVSDHDSDRCSICLVCTNASSPYEPAVPEFFVVQVPFVLIACSSPIFVENCDCSSPRGPPSLPA